jgi:hypothetical protein
MRATELAHEIADRFAHGRGDEVELTGLGRPGKLPVLRCPQIAGFQLSTEAEAIPARYTDTYSEKSG